MKTMQRPSRREFLGGLAAASMAARSEAAERPNIVFVLTDDQGYGDLACHGNPVVKTPNLDHLHSQSVRLTDYHVSPTCAPTRCSLLTGRHEFKSGVTHTILERERMSLKATTIAQALKSAGYATGIFGKWHLGDAAAYQPNRRGFDEVFIHGCGGIGQDYPGTCSDAPGNTYINPTILHNGAFERTQGYCTDVFFSQALRWIESRRNAGGPFFAYITPNAPHAPLICPEEYQRIYRGQNLGEDVEKYFGMVTNIDDNVGRLMSRLNQWGLDRNTLLIFMTDNGGTGGVRVFNAGMRGAKGTPYQGGTRAPAFFRWTGSLQPGDVAALAAHIDIFPTFAALAGAQVPAGVQLDGRSLVPVLNDKSAPWPDRFLFTHVGRWEPGRAAQSKYLRCSVRSARYSLVNSGPEEKWELYDVMQDPGEKKNVVAALPEQAQKMDAAYDRWWEEIQPGLQNETAVPPAVAPYKEIYWKQFGGGPGILPRPRGE
jgi:arylsulfatase